MREPLSRIDVSAAEGGDAAPSPPIVVEPWHPRRREAEAFIQLHYHAAFGARPITDFPTLVARLDHRGRIAAAAGVRLAEEAPLFLENYLDEAVEQAVAAAFGCPVTRASIAEIGGFAATDVCAAISLFEGLAAWLAGPGRRRYAVATARPELERLLRRSGFDLRPVAEATSARLGASASAWGSYYNAGPCVFAGQIGTPRSLPRLRLRLEARSAQQDARARSEQRS